MSQVNFLVSSSFTTDNCQGERFQNPIVYYQLIQHFLFPRTIFHVQNMFCIRYANPDHQEIFVQLFPIG